MFQIAKWACTLLALAVLASCGGSQSTGTPPPGPDFSVNASPVSASAVLGNPTSEVAISVAPAHGFNNSVDISLQGLPQGVDATPPSFSLPPGTSHFVTFSVSASAAVGVFPITVLATSGSLSHSASVTLNTEPIVSIRTFQSGSILWSKAVVDSCSIRAVFGGADWTKPN